jgi:hypothetical protein
MLMIREKWGIAFDEDSSDLNPLTPPFGRYIPDSLGMQ